MLLEEMADHQTARAHPRKPEKIASQRSLPGNLSPRFGFYDFCMISESQRAPAQLNQEPYSKQPLHYYQGAGV